ncbi:MAG: OmpA family protein [Nitrospirae bacterium]|nr:OmpA family protein [Nitrospirota bacterium]
MSGSAQAAFNPSNSTSKKIDIIPKFSSGSQSTVRLENITPIKEVLKDLDDSKKLNIFQDSRGIVIRITDTALFDSGNAVIKKESIEAVDNLAGVLASMKEKLQVEGHTDNVPISSVQFPSNWELSSARAASIVRRFIAHGIEPARLTAIGYGEYRPIAGNDAEEGRAKNRRVDIVILNEKQGGSEEQFVNPFANLKVE